MSIKELLCHNESLLAAVEGRIEALQRDIARLDVMRTQLLGYVGMRRKRGRDDSHLAGPSTPFPTVLHRAQKRWSSDAKALLVETASRMNCSTVEFSRAEWVRVSVRMPTGSVYSPFDCFLCYREIMSSTEAPKRREVTLIYQSVDTVGRRWADIAAIVKKELNLTRTPFQLLRTYRNFLRTEFVCTGTPLSEVWREIKALGVDGNNADHHHITVLLNRSRGSALPYTSDTARAALACGVNEMWGEHLIFWSLLHVMCPCDFDGHYRPPSMAVRSKKRYEQMTLEEAALTTGCTTTEITDKIWRTLSDSTRAPLTHDFLSLSTETFGHSKCALLLFQAALAM